MKPDKTTILYVEDDETLGYLTVDNLSVQNYQVIHCVDGVEALQVFKEHKVDLCLLDVMLPRMDGFELAKEIRKFDLHTPILFLSARTLKEDRIKGLQIGADDYLIKPFSIEELLLKIEIFLKRTQKHSLPSTKEYEVGQYLFTPDNYTIYLENQPIRLTQMESDLLLLFLQHKNQVLKREQILMRLWGDDDYFIGRSLDVFISRLRKLLHNANGITIENLRGIGFKFKQE